LATDSRRTARHHLELDQRYRLERHQATVAQAAAGLRAVGNIMVMLFVVLACLMAAHALHADRQQMQQLERLR
jgi:ubiquitin C-terminal hydrolase